MFSPSDERDGGSSRRLLRAIFPPMKFRVLLCSALVVARAAAAVPAPPLADAAPDVQRGLTLTFTTPDGQTDTRTARFVQLFVPAGAAPTPFLPPGAFAAKWEGEIHVPLRTPVTFTAESSGGFTLSVNGVSVLDDANAKTGKRVSLAKGANKIVAELKRPEQGDAFTSLRWAARDFPTEPMPPTAFRHDVNATALRTGERLRQGRMLFAQLRCAACHEGGALVPPRGTGMPELAQDAPLLGEYGARFQETWMAHWISDPHAIRPGTLMPKVFAAKPGEVAQEAADLAAYFATLGTPSEKPIDAALAPAGGALFANLGCIACHSKPDAAAADSHGRVALAHVKAKWQPAALTAYLKNPQEHFPGTRMPHFRLGGEEAARLTAYLVVNAKRDFPAGPKGDAAKGSALLVSANCLNCHAGTPPMTTPNLDATLADGWTKGCMAPDAAARGKAPDFALTAAQRGALLAFAGTDFASLKQDTDAEFADRQIANLRCTACHGRDGEGSVWSKLDAEMAPLQAAAPHEEGEHQPAFSTALPPLTLLGEKLQTDWMAKFIAGQDAEKPRPWLIPRMPGFPAPLTAPLARGLAHQHGLPLQDAPLTPDAELAKAGETLLGAEGGFNCVTCHGVGAKPPTAVFEAPGINLGLSAQRLRHGYYLRWVMYPLRIDPDTKMPRFSDDEGRTPLTDRFDGDAVRQFDAIWHHLHSVPK